MKIILYIILFSITNFSCLQKKNTENTLINEDIIIDEKTEVKGEEVSICLSSNRDLKLYERFITKDSLIFESKTGGRLYHGATKNNFKELFKIDKHTCIVPLKGDNLNIYDIIYESSIDSKEIFQKIKSIERTTNNLNAYHDFFKRGLIFIHSQEKNKITIIAFNPFLNNKLPVKFKDFFKKNNELFDNVFMTLGIASVEELVIK